MMLKSANAFSYACRFIDFSSEQKRLLMDLAETVDADAVLSTQYECDRLALFSHNNHNEICDPTDDPAHPIHALGKVRQRLYPTLVLLSAVKELEKFYIHAGIPMNVFRDTLSDIPLWMNHCAKHFGDQGMMEYEWLSNHMRGRLFRLGRLEFIYTKSRVPAYFYRSKTDEKQYAFIKEGMKIDRYGALSEDGVTTFFLDDGKTVKGHLVSPLGSISPELIEMDRTSLVLMLNPGASVLDVHIPEGSPLTPDNITKSLDDAPLFFKRHFGITDSKAFTCGSWLMAPGLSHIIPGSNIEHFQRRFHRIPYTLRDNQVFERVYGKECIDWTQRKLNSRLQKGVYEWYLEGGNLRQMQGVILLR